MLGLGMRTVWIALRAVNYTDRAMMAASKNLQDMTEKEQKLIKQEQIAAQATLQSGMMFVAMGYMATTAIGNILKATTIGTQTMTEFGDAITNMKTAMADALFRILGPFIEGFTKFLNVIAQNQALLHIISLFLIVGTVLVTLFGIIRLGQGMIASFRVAMKLLDTDTLKYVANLIRYKIPAQLADLQVTIASTIAHHALAFSIAGVVAGFLIAYSIFSKMPPIVGAVAAAIMGLVAAIMILHAVSGPIGWAMLAGGLAVAGASIGAAYGAYSSATGNKAFEQGTMGLPYTGAFFGHKGEVVYNPRTNRPAQAGNDLSNGNVGTQTNIIDVPITIQNVHTKADVDDLQEQVGEAFRKAGRRRR